MMTILSYDQWLADADCPELVDAFNGPLDTVSEEDDEWDRLMKKAHRYADEMDCSFDAAMSVVMGGSF